jgi:hypothetical protein
MQNSASTHRAQDHRKSASRVNRRRTCQSVGRPSDIDRPVVRSASRFKRGLYKQAALGNTGPMPCQPTSTIVDFDEWPSDVHDVFMNAQLMRTLMDAEPVFHGATEFMTSRRGRLEHAAMRDLYVLIEAFDASPPPYLDELRRLSPAELNAVASLLVDRYRVLSLRQIRDYMSHRDVRRYLDIGRLAVVDVDPMWYRTVESAFAFDLHESIVPTTTGAKRRSGSATMVPRPQQFRDGLGPPKSVLVLRAGRPRPMRTIRHRGKREASSLRMSL